MSGRRNTADSVGWLLMALLAGAVASGCGEDNPTRPSASDLTGTWSGTSTYPNAPFEVRLTQSGGTLRGQYVDRHDSSVSVTGTLSNSAVSLIVDFGDAKLNLDGTVGDARTVQGTMHTSALGNTPYPFTMTR